MDDKFLILDCNSLIHRAFYALPSFVTKKGKPVGAVYGFFLMFFSVLKEFKPDFVVATFDSATPTFRHKEYQAYKAKRPKLPSDLLWQINKTKEILNIFGISVIEKEGFEADDLIGTIAKLAIRKRKFPPLEVIIVSGDADMLSLVGNQIKVYFPQKGVKKNILFDFNLVKEKYDGLEPSQLTDYRALRGDPSDNIPGVRGIGRKTAISLLKKFRTLENLYAKIEKRSEETQRLKPKIRELLLRHKEDAFFSKRLAKINSGVPLDIKLKDCSFTLEKKDELVEAFKKLGFLSLIKKLPEILN